MDQVAGEPKDAPQVGGFHAASFDDDTGNFLYDSDVQQIIAELAVRLGRKLDVVGYDACLMAMIETAYGFRNSAAVMVASEELEPGAGWDYAAVMKSITSNPTMGPSELANALSAPTKSDTAIAH
jgi:Clostripain family